MRLRLDRRRQYPHRGRAVGQAEARGRSRERGVGEVTASFAVIAVHVASEAKQSIPPCKERMDCFVAEPVIGRAFARPVGSSQSNDGAASARISLLGK